jgi:hypothetical protein
MNGISSQQKEGSSKKREQRLKSKRGETSYEELHATKNDDEIYNLLGEILSKERQKGDHIFL